MRLQVISRLLVGLAVLAGAGQARAQDPQWAHKMFDKLDQDFGIVPSGADLKARIKITNKYQQTVHIAGVSSSCGCTAAKPAKDTLASDESTYLEVTMDARKFTHLKETFLTVTFNQPLFAEVRIPVKAYINPDVLLNPGAAEFGGVTKGADTPRRIAVTYVWRGRSALKEAVCKNPHVASKLVEVRRDAAAIHYELHVTIKGTAPLGELRDQVTLVNEDPSVPGIPVLVDARIEPEYGVSPDLVSFGTLAPGERKMMNIVVRGKKSFTIEKIESEKTAGTFEVRLPKASATIHVLPLTLIAPREPGTLKEEFTITVSGSPEPVTFKAYAKIVSPAGVAPAAAPTPATPGFTPQNP
jgi:hypothetical protein